MADDEPPPTSGADPTDPAERLPGESIVEVLRRETGVNPRVLLRDAPGEESPVLRVHTRTSDEAAKDDSRYQVLGEIGRGGVGIIFKSRDRDLGRDVAMKVLRPEMAEKAHVVERFVEEAQVAGQLQHPGVVPVYGMGLQPDGRPFFTMKLVKGKTLAALLSGRRDPHEQRRRFLGIFEQVCQTMAYAHARGVVHRDLKPANVMVGAFGEVQIMDWGFAKVLGRKAEESSEHSEDSVFEIVDTVRSGSEGSQSLAGSVMGTPAYMPPEQAMGRIDALDERADVFALGSILCEILTGKPAYTGESTEQLVQAARAQLDDATERLAEASVSDELKDIATGCLAPAAGARPRDAGFVAQAIGDHLAAVQERARTAELAAARAKTEAEAQRRALSEERARAEREQAREEQRRREAAWAARGRKRALILAALIIVGLLVGSGAWYAVVRDREDRARDATERVHAALREASQQRALGSWDGALDTVAMARQLADQHIDDADLSARIDRLEAQIVAARDEAEAAAKRLERNKVMVAKLQEIGAWVARQNDFSPRGDDPESVDEQYGQAFRDYGIDVGGIDPDVAMARIHGSGITDELTSALDDWVWVRRVGRQLEPAQWRPLVEIANRADNDALRVELRAAIHDSHGNELRRLAAETNLAALPARTLAMMGRALIEANDFGAATKLLRDARRMHPAHVGISHYLSYILVVRNTRMLGGGKPNMAELHEALNCRSAIVGMRPDADESWVQLGNVLMSLDRFEEGRAAFWRAVELAPDTFVNHVGVARSYGLAGEANELLQRRYEQEARRRDVAPNEPAFLLGLGLGNLEKGRFAEAIPYLEAGMARAGENESRFASALAFAYLRESRVQEALESAYVAVEAGMQHAPVVALVARDQAFRKRDIDAALGTLDAVLGKWGRGWLNRLRTRILIRAKRFKRALELLEPRVEAGNEPRTQLLAVGDFKARLGDLEGARAAWDKALAAVPDDPGMKTQVAWQLSRHDIEGVRDAKRALELAQAAVKGNPRSWTAHLSLAAALHANDRLDEAQKAVSTFLEANPIGAVWVDAGRLWAALGERELARDAYEAAVKRFPTDAAALNRTAWAFVMPRDGDAVLTSSRAVELARRAVARAPQSWAWHNTLAYALLRDGKHAEALAAIEHGMGLNPKPLIHPMDAFVRAMALWHLERKDEARTWLDKGLFAQINVLQMSEADEGETLRARDEALALIKD